MMNSAMIERLAVIGGGAAFCLVAILNVGGYRYGIGDQAFYMPIVIQHFDPGLFPRDRLLLHAQDQFMLFDEIMAAAATSLGVSVPALFFGGYLMGMILLFGGIAAVGRVLFRSWWTTALLAGLLTLRHRITQTGANTLEAYFQPRMMVFALGVWAIAAYLRGRAGLALVLVGLGLTLHPTTALWFGIWIMVATAVSERKWRAPLVAVSAIAAAAGAWMVAFGPLRGHLGRIDPSWASVLAGKDYIFPSDWGPAFWLVNFGYLAVVLAIYRMRRQRGIAQPREHGIVVGAVALVGVFLLSWPLMSLTIALAVQLQTSRIFWMLDLLASIYIAWLLAEATPPRMQRIIVSALIAVAVGRGIYVTSVEHAGEPIVRVGLPPDNWTDVMNWISKTPIDSHVLADPNHASRYGISVRVAGQRDVYLEDVKDTALALYSREVAMRVLDRIQGGPNFNELTPEQAQALAARFDLDYMVTERDMALPIVYRNDQFRVYRLGTSSPQ